MQYVPCSNPNHQVALIISAVHVKPIGLRLHVWRNPPESEHLRAPWKGLFLFSGYPVFAVKPIVPWHHVPTKLQ